MTHAKFHFNWLMLTLIFGIWASEPPPWAWRTTEKAGPNRVKIPQEPVNGFSSVKLFLEAKKTMQHLVQADVLLSISQFLFN